MLIFHRSNSRPSILQSLLILFVVTTCAGTETTTCSTGLVCPTGKVCVNDGKECALPSCGDGIVDPGEGCDEGANNEPAARATCSATCQLSDCGNGTIEFDEKCEPSVNDAGAACREDCKYLAECGNGTWDETMGEECDGKDLPPGAELKRCSDECKVVSCGNGLVEEKAGEQCEPQDPRDQQEPPCNDDCSLSVCGDEKKGPNEVCDPSLDPDCEAHCQGRKNCGNNELNEGEECDPTADGSSPEVCTPNCKSRGCGNGEVDQIGKFNEVCDDGNTESGDGCSADCFSREVCGDGVVNQDFEDKEADHRWELCDDGNNAEGDACSKDCKRSTCGNTHVDPGEDCDNGPSDQEGRTTESDNCNVNCNRPRCGDGIFNSLAETCDGNIVEGIHCNGALAATADGELVECQLSRCGDNYVNTRAGEQCEPDESEMDEESGDTSSCNGAQAPDEAKCRLPRCGDGYVNEQAAEACEPSLEDGYRENTKDSPTCNGHAETTPVDVQCKVATCGDGYTNGTAGEVCDEGPETASCNRSAAAAAVGVDCLRARCGDGYVNQAAGEQCEPGLDGDPANEAGDSVNCNGAAGGDAACKEARCGDGYTNLAAGECGDAPGDSATCNSNQAGAGVACKAKQCGDGYSNTQAGERCDLGPTDTAACNGNGAGQLSCQPSTCGDGHVNAAARETCDPSASLTHASWNDCNPPEAGQFKCLPRVCGDGFKHPKEACDSNADSTACNGAGATSLAGKPAECTLVECGDGYVNKAAEECDPGTGADSENCNGRAAGALACHARFCGDGYVHPNECGEADAPTCNGAGAPFAVRCRTSACGDGYINGEANETCEVDSDGEDTPLCNGKDAVGAACRISECGDGHVNAEAGEECDPLAGTATWSRLDDEHENETAERNSCNTEGLLECKRSYCGDAYLNPESNTGTGPDGQSANEGCDQGIEDTNWCNGAGGNSACQVSVCGDGRVNVEAGEECDPTAPVETWPRITDDSEVGDPTIDEDASWLPPANSCNPADTPLECKRARCGDGYVNTMSPEGETDAPFEQCEPAASKTTWFSFPTWTPTGDVGNESTFPLYCNGDGLLKCRFTECGDGFIGPGEQCDPASNPLDPSNPSTGDSANCNGSAASGRHVACSVSRCGDGYTNAESGEECDDGGPTARCDSACQLSLVCGDGRRNEINGEECEIDKDQTWKWCNAPEDVPENSDKWCREYGHCGDGICNLRIELFSEDERNCQFQILCPADCGGTQTARTERWNQLLLEVPNFTCE